ncbi:MAG: ATP-dependent Clp protease ATP-binding subunit ClpX [Pseudomonadales bacterium]|jgi:ATP-dependent Clp protease ATP-binding subunit ClpX|uniref:ATP-dependent Clp protease ATP-binding subunit ClpX n=1 Tax=unclassified Ketobacter TaxID=2639109 RepID=UPI000C8B200C|nr:MULTISPECIES: ATP-dependent Clp protease ATP-binding subunit ClpX [unclassified Ketobacter]MAA59779.1 ATP-dependent Clp protease ATP-binding subunit ClpX [Pseudomonadales bacterium]MEC8811698.1 ATP-dependent Clp protease ATP-binding subunit ClpX [Pseudomonadota bacterium]TNC84527.1 MAG: ATP-dependent Clp protease ATP-binding subunit ClpX [Alcanivorax sp.]HAG95682.1 ATP-dependent Clp protease ATP-binding subunit ClpX [Gammaproteobacteria bacterium]MAQ26951.1 ATP-dependent Clp protease ATP-bi|tara:strand:+ start:7321 stop:8661 length:1341 start_codon:yes stop_codon:yes gene_type:complete
MAENASITSVVPTCSFCGVEKSAEVPLIAGNDGHICEQCVKLAFQVVSSWGRKAVTIEPELKTPAAIKDYLDEYIIGQDEAKKTLSVAVYNHYLRLMNQGAGATLSQLDAEQVELEKSNVLMAGPSGTGKTLLVKTLARIIGVPFVVGDATSLTQAGYVGDDVESLLKRLLEAAQGDVQQAQWGIVYIDEIDKLAKRGSGGGAVRDISGEGVQQALLKMVEGTEVHLPKSGRRDGGSEEVILNTQNILFIVGGAFPGLTEVIGKRLRPPNTGIGFSAPIKQDDELSNDELLAGLQPDDLQQFGLIPEFIGRFPIITFLHELDVASLKRILQEPRNALTKQYRQLFSFQGVDLEFTESSLDYIAGQAVKRGTGARGLRAMLESLLRTTMFELPSKQGLEKCEITVEETVEGAPDGGVDPEAQKLVVKEVISEPAPNQGITKEAVPAV